MRLQCPKCGHTGEVTKKVREDEKYEYYECPTCRMSPHVWKVKKEEIRARQEEEAKRKEGAKARKEEIKAKKS